MRDTLNYLFKIFVGITLSVCAYNATRLVSILDQTTLTNGRVTDLERWRDVLKGQWRIVVFFAVGFGSAMGYLIKHFWG